MVQNKEGRIPRHLNVLESSIFLLLSIVCRVTKLTYFRLIDAEVSTVERRKGKNKAMIANGY